MFLHFFLSHYLNRITESRQRATVLSFKSMCLNLAYGLAGLLYSGTVAWERDRLQAAGSLPVDALEDAVFIASMGWFPWYFLVLVIGFVYFAGWRLRGRPKQHPHLSRVL